LRANPNSPKAALAPLAAAKKDKELHAGALKPPGVQPYWTGDTAKEDATGYATARAKFGRGEIRVLNHDGTVQTII